MKKWMCAVFSGVILLSLTACNSQSDTPKDDEAGISATVTTTPTVQTDESVWYSEEDGVHGRIWLGMTEKEVYDTLNKYSIPILDTKQGFERDKYGADNLSSDYYYAKRFWTKGHQYFYFDENNRLAEIHYSDQLRQTMDPVNEEFEAQRGVQRRGAYKDMINAYGEPDQIIENEGTQSCVYYLENGDYLHFVYQGLSLPILSIHYCKTPYPYSVW